METLFYLLIIIVATGAYIYNKSRSKYKKIKEKINILGGDKSWILNQEEIMY